MATPTASDPTGMIRAKDLHALLKQHVDDQGGSGGAMLTTGKGATLSQRRASTASRRRGP